MVGIDDQMKMSKASGAHVGNVNRRYNTKPVLLSIKLSLQNILVYSIAIMYIQKQCILS